VILGARVTAGDIPISEAALGTDIETRTKEASATANLECFERGMRTAADSNDQIVDISVSYLISFFQFSFLSCGFTEGTVPGHHTKWISFVITNRIEGV